jgi:hypothetical protein
MKTSTSIAALCGFLVLAVLLSACGPIAAQDIAMVTPLPQGTQPATATPVPTSTPAAATLEPTATPTPWDIQLPQGNAAAIAMATDIAMQPEVENPISFEEEPVPITFDEFYEGFDMRKGLTLSDKLLSLDGTEVVMEGYMAPPLKPELDWFVLTQIRLEFCPFCSSDADWPTDIAVVYLTNDKVVATQAPVRIQGRMEIGSSIDPETGMVSLVRIYADEIETL